MLKRNLFLLGTAALALAGCGADDVASPGEGVIVTPTPTPTPTPAPTPTPTPTPTPAPTPAPTPTPTPTPAPAPTPTPTPTPAPSPAPTPAPYAAPVPPPAGYVITPSGRQPIRSANDTAEFRRNYGANEFVNGLYALDAGFTGKGVTVAVIDDGVLNVNGELDGRIDVALSRDFGTVTSGGTTSPRNVLGDAHADHGTAVANIIAANRNGSGTAGFAPDVQLAVLRIADWNEDTKTETLLHVLEALDHAGRKGIKLVNSSLSSGASEVYADAIARYGATGGLIVNSAGNAGLPSPNDAGSITAANRNAVVFVGALSGNINDHTMATYSNLAGTMADRYVVAVGTNVTTTVDGTVTTFSGTSSATPVVAALAATILSKWPQLSGQQAGEVILNTARDLGDPGVDPVFGHGLVDFKAALAPVNPTLSNGTRQTSLQSSVMSVPAAMAVSSIQTALANVTVLDDYGRDFTGSVAGMVIRPEEKQGHWLRRRIAQMGPNGAATLAAGRFAGSFGVASLRYGPRAGDVQLQPTSGSLSYVAGGVGLRAGWNENDSIQSDIMGLAPFANGILAYAPQAGNSVGVDRYLGGGRLGLTVAAGRSAGTAATATVLGWSRGGTDLRVGLIDETGSVMGTPTGQGALRLGRGATTAMMEAHRAFAIAPGWTVEGYGSLGVTRLKVDAASLVTGASAIVGSRLGVQASGLALGGVASIGIAQPLTVERGAVRLTYAGGYDLATRSLDYASVTAQLAGERRVQLTAGWAKGGPRSSLRLGVMHDVNRHTVAALSAWSLRL